MVLGRPYNLTISSKHNLAIFDASDVLEQGRKWAILENLTRRRRMESCFLSVLGRPNTKLPWSIKHRKGSVKANIFLTMLRQLALSTLANYLGNIPLKTWSIKLSLHLFNSLITPLKCPTSPLECNFHIKKSRTKVHGMHSLLILNK